MGMFGHRLTRFEGVEKKDGVVRGNDDRAPESRGLEIRMILKVFYAHVISPGRAG